MIFLTGMPGVGKTTFAKKWAKMYGWNYADLDIQIEQAYKMTIAALFEKYGEQGFRQIESDVLKAMVTINPQNNMILSCGGGTPCFNDNLKLMQANGVVVWIQKDVPTLVLQLMQSKKTKRPLLQSYTTEHELVAYLEDLLSKRVPYFEQSDYHFYVNDEIDSKFAALINSQT